MGANLKKRQRFKKRRSRHETGKVMRLRHKHRTQSVDASRLEYFRRDHIRVHVGGGATILEIPAAVSLCRAWDAHRSSTVGHTIAELVDGCRLMRSSETTLVTSSIDANVFLVLLAQLFDCGDDLCVAALVAHGLGRVVSMAASSIPIARNRFWIEGHIDTLLLADADHQVARHPHIVSALDAFARADLVLP